MKKQFCPLKSSKNSKWVPIFQNTTGFLEEIIDLRFGAGNVQDEAFQTNKQGSFQRLSKYSGVNWIGSTEKNWENLHVINDITSMDSIYQMSTDS